MGTCAGIFFTGKTFYMKKLLNLCLLLSFQFGYLEWGKGYHTFIFQAEAEILSKAMSNAASAVHPLIVIPLAGLLILLYTIFQKTPSRFLRLSGLACLSVLMLLLLFIGVTAGKWKIFASTIPFFVAAYFVLRANWKRTAGV